MKNNKNTGFEASSFISSIIFSFSRAGGRNLKAHFNFTAAFFILAFSFLIFSCGNLSSGSSEAGEKKHETVEVKITLSQVDLEKMAFSSETASNAADATSQFTASATAQFSTSATSDSSVTAGSTAGRPVSSRNINPAFNVSSLTDIKLTGKFGTGSINVDQNIKSWADYEAFQTDSTVSLMTGSWPTLTLSAKIPSGDGSSSYDVEGSLSNVLVSKGVLGGADTIKVNLVTVSSLDFTLDYASGSTVPENGGLSLSLTYTGEASKILASLEKESDGSLVIPAETLTSVTIDADNKIYKVDYTKNTQISTSSLAEGYYRLKIYFYGGEGTGTGTDTSGFTLLTTYSELVYIKGGYISSANRNITLNELYSITYHWNSGSLASGTAPGNYSIRSGNISLPLAKMAGGVFAGWYDNASFTGTPLTELSAGSSGDKEFWALFLSPILYVDQNGTKTGTSLSDGFSTDSALQTLQQAVNQINTVVTDSSLVSLNSEGDLEKLAWNISISGTISKATEISDLKAKTLTIYGDSYNYFDSDLEPDTLTIASSEESSYKSVIKINAPSSGVSLPDITLQYLKITGGKGQYGGALDIEGGSLSAEYVTFTENHGLINNTSAKSYGGAIYVNTDSESGIVTLENCEITNNTSGSSPAYEGHGGAVYLKSAKQFILSDADDTSAPGNTITGNQSDSGGGIELDETYTGTIELKGKFNISGNTSWDGYQFDIWLPYGKKIKINGPLAVPAAYPGTGIYMDFTEASHTPPSLDEPVIFTEGYNYYVEGNSQNSPSFVNILNPGSIFIPKCYNGDKLYPVSFTVDDGTGEACFESVSSQIHNAFAYNVSLSSSLTSVSTNDASTLTISPMVTYKAPTNVTREAGEPEPAPIPLYYNPADGKLYKKYTEVSGGSGTFSGEDRALDLSVSVYNRAIKVADLSLSDTSLDGAKNTFTVPAFLYEDYYTIYVKATLDGIAYDAEFPLEVSRGLGIPLTLEAAGSAVTVTFVNNASGLVKYRIDDGSLQTIAKETTGTINLDAGQKIEFYGDNKKYFITSGIYSSITCNAPCYIYGNIMSLISSTDFGLKKELEEENTFRFLFYQNEYITNKAGEKLFLPAMELSNYCYYSMFRGCKNLKEAPELPAESLKDSCYAYMFDDCELLEEAPELPATSLAPSCYEYMFNTCKNLSKGPDILPAGELAEKCYSGMFWECSKLETAPVLPAKILVDECYRRMFKYCALLNNVTCYATNISASNCTESWLDSVASSGTFTKAPGMSGWLTYNTSGIPGGWTVIDPPGSITTAVGSFDGTLAISGSGAFISGRVLEIPSLIAENHEVTQKEYSKYMAWYGDVKGTEYTPTDTYGKGDDFPAYFVSWYEAVMYCNLRSQAEGLTPAYYLADSDGREISGGRKISIWMNRGQTLGNIKQTASGKYYFDDLESIQARFDTFNYEGEGDDDGGIRFDTSANGWRLPTAVEWEYLARGGNLTNTNQTTYSGSDLLDEVAWYGGNADGKSHEVMKKKSNSLGFYDMTGNVWEWCWDWHGNPTYSTPITGREKDTGYDEAVGPRRIFMGGCWTSNSSNDLLPTIGGFNWTPLYRAKDIGFRVVRNAE